MIVVVDFGMGNVRSIVNKLNKMHPDVRVSSNPGDIMKAQKLILPGVGHFKKGMANLRQRGLLDCLKKRVLQDEVPVLGICLGMQLFTEFSEEGNVPGLMWVPLTTRRFQFEPPTPLRVPHVSWSAIKIEKNCPLLEGIDSGSRFYFTHSYFVPPDESWGVASAEYGHRFGAVIQKNNVYGTQFHPEKSHHSGKKLLENFIGNC